MRKDRALIFVNGEQIDLNRVGTMIQPGDFLAAADGGLRYVRGLNRLPDLLIGDLDSVEPAEIDQMEKASVRVVRHPVHKDETDLELAINTVLEMGCSTILIIGALGGRLDMTLSNIFLLALPALRAVDARLEDGVEEVFLIREGAAGRKITGEPGDRVSLLPWGGPAQDVLTEGLVYPLRSETLYPERSRGISNEMESVSARVSLSKGTLICVHTRQK